MSDDYFIYIFECEDYIKIGVANNVLRRLAEIQATNPYDISLLAYYRTTRAFATVAEKQAHKSLDKKRHRGEWFTCSYEEASKAVDKSLKFRWHEKYEGISKKDAYYEEKDMERAREAVKSLNVFN